MICPASSHETCQWLKFPPNGLRAQSSLSPVVGLLPSVSGLACSRVMKRYSPTGRRNHGRPLKRLLDTWDRNGSTSGPTPWQIYDDDDYHDIITTSLYFFFSLIVSFLSNFTSWFTSSVSLLKCHLTFVDPCIIAQFIKKNPTIRSSVSKFYYSVFMWSSSASVV